MTRFSIFTLILLVAALTGCSSASSERQAVAPLYREMANYADMTQSEKEALRTAYPDEIRAMMQVAGFDTICDNTLSAWSISPTAKAFAPATDSIFPSIKDLEFKLGAILANAKDEGLQFPERHYAATIWSNLQSILFVDNCMLVALNHYLGSNFEGYSSWPNYLRANKTPQHLPYDIAEALVATQYPFAHSTNSTAISHMLYEGALIVAKMRLVPKASEAEALGYSNEQLSWLRDNEEQLWLKLVKDRLLYSSSQNVIDQLIAPAPITNIISPRAPGRAGRYIGYRIVCEYLHHNEQITLPQLLSPAFYTSDAILIQSKYSGK